MKQYHDLMNTVLAQGDFKENRTGTSAYSSIGHMVKYDLERSFEPAVTTKKLAFQAVKGELLGFFRGYDNAAKFRELSCKVWDQNANETPSWLANPVRKGEDDLGRIYGVQWRSWRDTRYARSEQERKTLEQKGYRLMAEDLSRGISVYEREINQLEDALRKLITDPFNRRIIVTGWRVDELDQMALCPCHVSYWFGVDSQKRLHSTLWIRSNDLFLGHAFNAASLGVFTHIMARLAGLKAASATIFISDAHVYENHKEQVMEQVAREAFEPPQLVLSDNIKPISSLDEIAGVFERIEPADIELVNYRCHPPIKAPMAV